MYGIFSLTGTEHPDPTKNPYNTMILITDAGEINMCASSLSATTAAIGSGASELQHISKQHKVRYCSACCCRCYHKICPWVPKVGCQRALKVSYCLDLDCSSI